MQLVAQRPSLARRVLQALGKAAKWSLILLTFALGTSALTARVQHRRDARRWKAPGRVLAVENGRSMHLYCTGSGTPTVVLEAGLGDFSISSWSSVQPQLSQISRTCSYDRAGTGWSDPPTSAPTATGIVDDLHMLLAKSGEPGPYLLVGHSLGGPLIRHYAVHYPAEVAGLVLVDGSHEDQLTRMKLPTWADYLYSALPVVHFLGLDRTLAGLAATDTVSALGAALTTTDKAMDNTITLAKGLAPFFVEVKADAKDFGELPLVALTAGKMSVPGMTPAQADSLHTEWVAMHKEIVARSRKGKWVLATESQHYIQRDQPDLVIDAVKTLVSDLRAVTTTAVSPTTPP